MTKKLTVLPALALLGALAAGGQEAPPEAPASPFGEVIDVRVVNLELVVTRNGERVTGLGPEDFVLRVDGREVPIEYFTEVHGGTAVSRGNESARGTLPALAPGTPVSTSYLLFIDEYFTVAPLRNRVLRKMIEQLPLMNPEDRMAVVAYNGKGLEMLSTWSQAIEALTRVLVGATERPAYGLERRAEQRSFDTTRDLLQSDDPRAIGRLEDGGRLGLEDEQRAERIASQVKRVTLAAASALRGFADPPGRKVMLLLSGGWPYDPARWVTGNFQISAFNTSIDYGDDLFGSLTETANRLSYTLYPVDVPGLDRDDQTNIERSSLTDANRDRDRTFDRRQDERAALDLLARDTGGKPLYGAATYAALERAASDTRTYYWIGFTPEWQGDDEAHKILVKPRQKGLKVRTRDGFADLSRQTEVSMMVESSLLFGNAPSASPLQARVGRGKKLGRGKVELPLTVIIPVAELTFLPYEGQFRAKAELRVAVQDEEGNLADIPVVPMTLALAEMPRQGELRRYDTSLRMRKRKHDVVVSLYDNASGKILTTRLEIDPKGNPKAN